MAIVDDCDADLNDYDWFAVSDKRGGFYAARNIPTDTGKQRMVQMHRIILSRMIGRELEDDEKVDHIHHKTTDNRRTEIRLATHSQNMANRRKSANNTSGYKGVYWHKEAKKFRAKIGYQGEQIRIGMFDSPEEAALAYDREAKKLFGEFAILNFPD